MSAKALLKKIGVGWIYSSVLGIFDRLACRKVEFSIGDVMLERAEIYNNQLLVTSRLLDVEEYVERGNKTFPWQTVISKNKYGSKYDEELANNSFEELIESYKKCGYKPNSFLTFDN